MAGPQRFSSSRGSIAAIALGGSVPSVLVESERGSEVARLHEGQLTGHVSVSGTPTGAMVVLGGAVFLSTSSADGASLVSVELGASRAQTIAALSTPHLALTPRKELVFTQGDQLALLSAHGVRALLELVGGDVEVETEIDDRRRGRIKTRVRNPLSVIGRVPMTTSIATTDEGVLYATVGDSIATDAIRFVPRIGGLPRVLFAVPDQEDPARGTIEARLGPIAASGSRVALASARSTTLGGRFGGELLVLDARDGSELARTPMSSAAAIVMAGDRIAVARRVETDEVIELWTVGGTSWKHVARRRGRGLAMSHDLLWYGDGASLVRVELATLSAGPSAKIAQLVELVRKAEGRYEKTSFQGKPAIKVTSADGSRSIKPVTPEELDELESLLRAV